MMQSGAIQKSTQEIMQVNVMLQSDMCCGTGESSGGVVDQLTAVDSYGLPIIPGKRLKGLIRESALLICGGNTKRVDDVFGKPGGGPDDGVAKVKISSAHLAGSEELQGYIGKENILPQRVTNVFTGIRYNTKINSKGIADDHSLRATQVVLHKDYQGRATIFRFTIEGDSLDPKEKELVEDSVRALRRIGLNKTRGFGEVICIPEEFKVDQVIGNCRDGVQEQDVTISPPDVGDAESNKAVVTVSYHITLEQDVVLSGGIGQTLDYFPGSMLQGVFARYTSKEKWFHDEVLTNTRFGNAYVDAPDGNGGNQPTFPVPVSMVTKKNAAFTDDEQLARDMSLFKANGTTEFQTVPLSGYCAEVVDGLLAAKVKIGYSFHNSLKTVSQNKQFYSLKRLEAGQSFTGRLTGTQKAIDHLTEVVRKRNSRFNFGAAGSTQFGACKLTVGEQNIGDESIEIGDKGQVIVQFLSDVILIDDEGNNSTDVAVLIKSLSNNLEFEFDVTTVRLFTKTIIVGGYNAYWHLPKRQYRAFQKGSILLLDSCGSYELESNVQWIGHLQNEGFGQILIKPVTAEVLDRKEQRLIDSNRRNTEPIGNDQNSALIVAAFEEALRFDEACSGFIVAAIATANESKIKDLSKSAAMRIASIYQSAQKTTTDSSLVSERFKEYTERNFSGNNNKDIRSIAHKIKSAFDEAIGNTRFDDKRRDALFEVFVQAYLKRLQIRYSSKGDNDA
jgi:CRISPR/Cas system CMR subunit Cmr6 (Cas7 group RAMP superfamily)